MADTKNSYWKWMKGFPLILAIPIVIILFISVFYLIAFIVTFMRNGISGDPGDWSDTATFMNLIVSVLNLIVFVVLSLLVYRYNVDRDKSTDAFQQAIERPILVFREEPAPVVTFSMVRYRQWNIVNIGNGPALNLFVTFKTKRSEDWVEPVTKCYSIGKEEKVALSWIRDADVTLVVYRDIFGNKFGSLLLDDNSFVENLDAPSSDDPFGIGITVPSLHTIFQMRSQRMHDALSTSTTSSTTSASSTTRKDDL